MQVNCSLCTLVLADGRVFKLEEPPKESNLLDWMTHKATSEVTKGKTVYLLAMNITKPSLLYRIHCLLKPDISEIGRHMMGKLITCTPRTNPRTFDVPYWFKVVPEEGATIVIYGADMIFDSYTTAVKTLKKVQEEKNCEIIFTWRVEDIPTTPPPATFETWDEINP